MTISSEAVAGNRATTVMEMAPYGFDPELHGYQLGQAEALLGMSDYERRKIISGSISTYLQERGLEGIAYLTNISAVLTPSQIRQLENHAGTSAVQYGGRMFGMHQGHLPQWPSLIVSTPPLESETAFFDKLAGYLGTQTAQRIEDEAQIPSNYFVYPFKGDAALVEQYGPERTISDATPFNSKSGMRWLLRTLGEEENIMPGTEIFYDPENDTRETFYTRIRTAIREQSDEAIRLGVNDTGKVWGKHAHTASGLGTFRRTKEDLTPRDGRTDEDIDRELDAELDAMFWTPDESHPDGGRFVFDDVVIEHHVPFGESRDGYGDMNFRGFITPDGRFIPTFVGKSINNDIGEYIGMVGARCDDPEQLANIGMTPEQVKKATKVYEKMAAFMHANGYWGPISADFFVKQFDPESPIWLRDFNMREGGTSYSGLITAIGPDLWGDDQMRGVLDTELNITAPRVLRPGELEALVSTLEAHGIFSYATTFLKGEKTSHTLKVIARQHGPATTTAEVVRSMRMLANQINSLGLPGGARFSSPL